MKKLKLGKLYKTLWKDWNKMKRDAIIEILRKKGKARTIEIAKELGLAQSTVIKEISRLVHKGVIQRVYSGSKVYYKLR